MLTRKTAGLGFALGTLVLVVMLGPVSILSQENGAAPADSATIEDPPIDTNPTRRLLTPMKNQSPDQQLSDQLACYEWTRDQMDWDPYLAYLDLVDAGYAVALTREEMEEGLVDLAARGAEIGAVAGDIAGDPRNGAEIGAAIAIAMAIYHSDFINAANDPDAQKAISRFERDLRKWNKKYSGCMVREGYKVSSP